MLKERMLKMYRKEDFAKEYYKVSELSKILSVSIQSIQNYIKQGRLESNKKEGSVQVISRESIFNYLQDLGELYIPERDKNLLIVDTVENLTKILQTEDIKNLITVFTDNNFEKKLPKIIDLITSQRITKVYIFNSSILGEQMFELIKNLCNKNDSEIIILKKEGF